MLVALVRLGRMHVDVTVEERLAARRSRRRSACRRACRRPPRAALRAAAMNRCIRSRSAAICCADALGIGRVVLLEASGRTGDRRRLRAAAPTARSIATCLVGTTSMSAVGQRRRLLSSSASISSRNFFSAGCTAAVGVDQLVDRRQQLVLVVAIEALEDLVAAQLELRVDELLDVLAVGDGLVEQVLHAAVDLLEHLVEVRR